MKKKIIKKKVLDMAMYFAKSSVHKSTPLLMYEVKKPRGLKEIIEKVNMLNCS